MRPIWLRPKYSGTMPPRTMVTSPLATPKSSAKHSSATLPSATANKASDAGMASITKSPTTRSDKRRLAAT